MNSIETQINTWLLAEREIDYQKFSSSLIPNINNVLGIRLPKLRKYAKTLLKQDYDRFLDHACNYMEEVMLQGMLIGLIKETPENKLKRIEKFVPQIDNWSVCDTFCCGLKFAKNNQQLVWEFLEQYISSDKEYSIRFALVMMLDYFINDEFIDRVLSAIMTVNRNEYYVKMAAAWALSICYIKFPNKTYKCLIKLNNEDVKKKAFRKICESYRVSKEDKITLKEKLF